MLDEIPKLIKSGAFEKFSKDVIQDLTFNNGKIYGTQNGQMFCLKDWRNMLEVLGKGNAKKLLFKF